MDFYSVNDVRQLHERSPIASFFYGKSVLLTGASGFLGQLYLEKLLRIGVKEVYVLMRAKKQSVTERIAKISSGVVFDKLRQLDDRLEDRIKLVAGDLARPQLAITEDDAQMLSNTIQIVIHSGADVRFDVSLCEHILSNVRGTKCLLELATRMKRLEQFVYVSTAYSHCVRSYIDECFYPPPMDVDFMIANAENWLNGDQRELIEIMTPKLIHPWPNSYTWSKALSEELVRRYGRCFNALVVRPSIIISTLSDPLAGWTNNLGGMNGVMLGIGVGFLHNMKIDTDVPLENVHADYVTNGTLAAIWHARHTNPGNARILHVTHKGAPMTVGNYLSNGTPMMYKLPLYCNKCVWYPSLHISRTALESYLINLLVHVLPSFVFDVCRVSKEVNFMRIARKIESLMHSFDYFMAKPLQFANDHMIEIQNSMSVDDRKWFACDTRNIDLLAFMSTFLMGLRIHMANDPVDTIPQSMQRKKIQKFVHYTVKYTMMVLLILFACTTFYKFVNK